MREVSSMSANQSSRPWAVLMVAATFAAPASLLAPSAASAQIPGVVRGFPDPIDLEPLGLVRRWYQRVPVAGKRERISTLKVEDGSLFVQSDSGVIHSIDAESGEIQWTATVGTPDDVVFRPAITAEHVYVTTGTRLIGLQRATGRTLWVRQLSTAATCGPAANAKDVYVAQMDKRFYCIAVDGSRRLKFTPFPVKWFYNPDTYILNPPVLLEDRVAFAGQDGILYCFTPENRQQLYRFFTGAPLSAPLSSFGETILIPSRDSSLYSVDLLTGKLRWRFISGYPIDRKALAFKNDVYITPSVGGVIALDNNTGELQWFNENLTKLAAASQEFIYGTDKMNTLSICDRKTGRPVGSYPSRDFSVQTENVFNDRVYLCTPDGLIVCLHEKGNQEPYIHIREEARTEVVEPTLPERSDDDGFGSGFAEPERKASGGRSFDF